MHRSGLATLVIVTAGCVAASCGGAARTTVPSTAGSTTMTSSPTAGGTTSSVLSSPGVLQAEATATAAGDIPDNQVFLVFANRDAAYSIKYPEGWAQQGSGGRVVFRDKNNIVRLVVGAAATPSIASVRADVARLKGATMHGNPQAVKIAGTAAIKVVYGSESAANPVTGKRVKLVVDRFFLWKTGRRAVVDLASPEGVDNVDAYRLMIESFRWK